MLEFTSVLISFPGIVGLFFSDRKYLCFSSIFTSFVSFLYWKNIIPRYIDIYIVRINYFNFLSYTFLLSNLYHKFVCWFLCICLTICYKLSCHFYYKNKPCWKYFHILFHLLTTSAQFAAIFLS